MTRKEDQFQQTRRQNVTRETADHPQHIDSLIESGQVEEDQVLGWILPTAEASRKAIEEDLAGRKIVESPDPDETEIRSVDSETGLMEFQDDH